LGDRGKGSKNGEKVSRKDKFIEKGRYKDNGKTVEL